MTTPLYPTFRKRIEDAILALDKNQVTPWAFLNSGKPFQVKTCDNTLISYQGIAFEGSPETVFWSRYIEPFLEKLCMEEISAAVTMAKERGVDGVELLSEVQSLFLGGFAKVYARMAAIDRRLRGRGFPEKTQPRSTAAEQAKMSAFLQEYIDAEKTMWVSVQAKDGGNGEKRIRVRIPPNPLTLDLQSLLVLSLSPSQREVAA